MPISNDVPSVATIVDSLRQRIAHLEEVSSEQSFVTQVGHCEPLEAEKRRLQLALNQLSEASPSAVRSDRAMSLEELKAFFDAHRDDYMKFDRISSPLFPRPDLCAFVKLHELAPSKGDIVSGASHDVIFLDVSPNVLAKQATPEDLIYLIRCGVRYDTSYDCLAMFA